MPNRYSHLWSVRRKKDRAKMAAELRATLEAAGATCEQETRGSREIVLRVYTPGKDGSCSVHFDGDSSQPGVWVVTWNTRARMCPSMGDVNEFHGCKAQRVFYSFDAMCAELSADVRRFVDGSAFAA